MPPVRVFHGDDSESYRYLVREVLPDRDLQVVGDAGDPEAIVAGVQESQPDVVLLDQIGGAQLVARLRAVAPGVRVIVLSGHQPGDGDRAMARCVDGYVVKAGDFDEVRAVVLGG